MENLAPNQEVKIERACAFQVRHIIDDLVDLHIFPLDQDGNYLDHLENMISIPLSTFEEPDRGTLWLEDVGMMYDLSVDNGDGDPVEITLLSVKPRVYHDISSEEALEWARKIRAKARKSAELFDDDDR